MNKFSNVLIVNSDENVESFIKSNEMIADKALLSTKGVDKECYVILPKDSSEVEALKNIFMFKFKHDIVYEQDSNGGFYKLNCFGGVTVLDKLRYTNDINIDDSTLSYVKLNEGYYKIEGGL